jgi:hypothetical protein
VKADFPLCPKRKAAFDELQRPLQRCEWCDQEGESDRASAQIHAADISLAIGSQAEHQETAVPSSQIEVVAASEMCPP